MQMQTRRLRAFAFAAGLACLVVSAWASADPPSRVARLGYTSGAVSFSPAGENDWVLAAVNRPLTTGDRLWADAGARAELQVGGAMLRMSAGTSVAVLNLDDSIAQLQLTQGTLNLRVRRLDPNQIIEIDTPNLAFTVRQPGRIPDRVDVDGNATDIYRAQGPGRRVRRRRVVRHRLAPAVSLHGDRPARLRAARHAGIRRVRSLGDGSRSQLRHFDLGPLCFAGRDRLSGPRCERHVAHRTRRTATSGSRVAWPPAGRRIATAIGRGSTRGAGRGWTMPPGASPCPTTAAGRTSQRQRGAGCPARCARAPTMPRRWSPSWAAATSSSRSRAGMVGGIAWFPLGPREVYRPSYAVSRRYFENVNVSNTVDQHDGHQQLLQQHERDQRQLRQPAGARARSWRCRRPRSCSRSR